MVRSENTWNPDTCNCHLERVIDDSLPPAEQVFEVKIQKPYCSIHKHLMPNALIVYNTVLDEQSKKNNASEIALQTVPNKLGDTMVNEEDGTEYTVLKPTVFYVWNFSGTAPNRVLNIQFEGADLTAQEKSDIEAAISQKYGTGVCTVT